MASERLSNLIKALRMLANDRSVERTLVAEREIRDYLATDDPTTRKEMLNELEREIIGETGEFWDTVREYIRHRRQTG